MPSSIEQDVGYLWITCGNQCRELQTAQGGWREIKFDRFC
jgi:hypothetical protein